MNALNRPRSLCFPTALILFSLAMAPALAAGADDPAYHDLAAVQKSLQELARAGRHVSVVDLAETPGGRKLQMLQIGPTGQGSGRAADAGTGAVLVVTNPLGTNPLSTEATLQLGKILVAGETRDSMINPMAAALTWYLIPAANPDGAARYHDRPRLADGRNDSAVDDDLDGEMDEDGPDDLNGDGLITTMLLADPEGGWLLTDDEPPLPKRANSAAGEQGAYQILREGKDDDEDGRFNEDGPGGVVMGKNFPHAFMPWTSDAGRWAASTTETRAILEFAFSHPEIVMVLVLGASNNLWTPPDGAPPAGEAGGRYRLPRWIAREAGVDTQAEFDLPTILEIVKDVTGRKDLTKESVLSYLSLGPAQHPHALDLSWWQELARQYRTFLQTAGLDSPRVDPLPTGPGSVQEWAYYQFGVPSFALDFWSVPKPPVPPVPEPGAAMGAPSDTLHAGATEPARDDGIPADLKSLASYVHENPGNLPDGGYLTWQNITLPDGREALVGGATPLALRTPPAAWIDSLVAAQLPFVFEIVTWLPELSLASLELDYRGADVYEVKVYVANNGRISYPTAQGARCRRPPPVALTLSGADILEGRSRQTIEQVPGLGAASSRWLVHGPPGREVTITLEAAGAGSGLRNFTLDRKGGSP